MRTLVAVSAVLIAVTATLAARGGSPAQKTLPFCGDKATKSAPMLLMPVDEAISKPDFFTYRARLQMAVAAHDVDAVVAMADRDIKMGFGGDDGADVLKRVLTGADAPDYWRSLGRILALGGAFRSASSFEAPYVYSNWPELAEPFECAAVTGSNVAIRQAGHADGPVVTRTSYNIIRLLEQSPPGAVWSRVELPGGRKGYIHNDYVWSPTALRAIFNLIKGEWRITALVSGD